jgi:lysozyme
MTQTPLQGIDVSHYQGTIDWQQVAQAGIRFVFVKATQGITVVDPQFQTNWQGAKAAGLLRGAYHFFEPDDDPGLQVQNLLAALGDDPGELPPALDVETHGDAVQILAGVQMWISLVEAALGRTVILYTSPGFWKTLGAPGLPGQPLWIAEYGVSAPKLPAGWTDWTFWQSSQSGTVAGIQGAVDLDEFQGTLEDLQRLA